jgi:hypothetical protein
MSSRRGYFRGAFNGPDAEASGAGIRPVVFDVMAPGNQTSLLPDGVKMVLHVNPKSMNLKYSRKVERTQTLTGWVEEHWGDDVQSISFSQVTGAFMRMYSGLSNTTNPAYGGTRRETLAYDSYLDMLALFHNNGSVYDSFGRVALQGSIKCTFDGGVYLGWMESFNPTQSVNSPYQFEVSFEFTVSKELQSWRSVYGSFFGGR